MANIDKYLEAINEAKYGRDVRSSIHDAIKEISEEEEQAVESSQEAAASAKASEETVEKSAKDAQEAAQSAADSAAEAAKSATSAAETKASADEAIAAAETGAEEAIKEAQAGADEAIAKAEAGADEAIKEAQTGANEAIAKANEAIKTAEATSEKWENTKTDIYEVELPKIQEEATSAAKAGAEEAQAKAEEAQAATEKAQGAAEEAQSGAEKALESADAAALEAKKWAEEAQAASGITVDSELDETSPNALQNKTIAANFKADRENIEIVSGKVTEVEGTAAEAKKAAEAADGKAEETAKALETYEGATDEAMEAYAASIKELDEAKHTHGNMAVLEAVTQEMIDDTHKHENMDALNALTQEVIDSAHKHENKEVVDKLTQEVLDDAHKHDNSDVLDKLGESDDGNLLFDGKEIQGGGGGGIIIPPKNPTGITVKELDGQLTVYWSDPEDNVVEGTTFATWGGTILVINSDHAPTDEKDGTVIINNTVRNAYATEGLDIEGLTNNQKYYLYFVPYTTAGVYGYSDANRRVARPAKVALDDVTDVSVSSADKSVTVNWTNPEQTKTLNGVTATWAKTLVVLKADSAPEDETDGIIYESTTYSEASHTFEVENGHDYYVKFFVVSDLDSIKQTDYDGSVPTYASVTVTTNEETLIGKIVFATWTDGDEEKQLTGSFGDMGFVQFKIPFMGYVTFTSSDGDEDIESELTIKTWGVLKVEMDYLQAFSTASWSTIGRMCKMAKAGTIDITDYWTVGDAKEGVPVAAIAATGVGESHAAQDTTWAITGILHDTLADGSGKAVITIGMLDALNEGGYMNSSYSGYATALWSSSARRTWMELFEKALPEKMQKLIVPVTKKTCSPVGGTNSTLATTTERCFLFSNWEVFGAAYSTWCTAQDGDQYAYFKTAANRIKKIKNSKSNWWLRSGYLNSSGSGCFVICNTSGAQYNNFATYAHGLVVGLCIS